MSQKHENILNCFLEICFMCLNFSGKSGPAVEQHTQARKNFRSVTRLRIHPAALFVLMYIYLCVLMSFCLCVCVRGSVLDVNDETPTFSPRVYNVSLKESVPRDHIVARLSCSDNDAGLNAELSYFITGQRSQWELFFVCLWATVLYSYGDYVHVQYLCPSIHLCVSLCMR